MGNVLVQESSLHAIGNAIREKTGSNTTYKPREMAPAIRNLPGAAVLQSVNVSENGIYTPGAGVDGFSSVSVAVPGGFSAADEGKVVQNGALMPQTSLTVSENGTYTTTANNRVVVYVSGELPSRLLLGTAIPSSQHGNDGDTYLQYQNLDAMVYSNNVNPGFLVDCSIFPSDAIEVRFFLTQVDRNAIYIASVAYSYSNDTGIIGVHLAPGGALQLVWSSAQNAASQVYTYSALTKGDCLFSPHTVKFTGNKAYVDGELVHTFSGTPDELLSLSNLCLFGMSVNNDYSYPAYNSAIVYCKVTDSNGDLKHHYTPFNEGGTAKMKDTVTGNTYGPSDSSALAYRSDRKLITCEWLKCGNTWETFDF